MKLVEFCKKYKVPLSDEGIGDLCDVAFGELTQIPFTEELAERIQDAMKNNAGSMQRFIIDLAIEMDADPEKLRWRIYNRISAKGRAKYINKEIYGMMKALDIPISDYI